MSLETTCKDLQKVLSNINSICNQLHNINTSIFKVETEDEELKGQVSERRRTVEEVSEVIERLSLPPDLMTIVSAKRINEDFERILPVLDEKVDYCRQAMTRNVLCANDVWTRLEPLLTTVYTLMSNIT